MLALLPITARAQTVGAALQALQQQFPGVQFHESGERIRAVYGVPMTQGATPELAAAAWLSEYAPVFGEPEPDLHVYSTARLTSGKTVLSYSQTVDGVSVMSALLTVVVLNEPTPTVVYAAARIAIRPNGGLSSTVVLAPQALLIAQAHPAANGFTTWREPEMWAWWQSSSPEAKRIWKCEGWSDTTARVFLIHATTGQVVHNYEPFAHFDVSGTIRAYVTPGLKPHTASFMQSSCPSPAINCCPNPPDDLVPLANLRVQAIHPTTSAVLDEAFTDEDGEYSLDISNGTQCKVRAVLEGPYWQGKDGQNCSVQWPVHTTAVAPEISSTGTAPFTADLDLNGDSDVYRTAEVNAMYHVEKVWTYFVSRIEDPTLPGLTENCRVVTNIESPGSCGSIANGPAAYPWAPTPPGTGAIGLNVEGVASYANGAFSTILAHEYGHYVSWRMRNIDANTDLEHLAWSEGYADSVAHMVLDTPNIGEQLKQDCDYVHRTPLDPTLRLYPKCDGNQYDRGMVLSGVWLRILANTSDLELTRQLHVDWSSLMMGGEEYDCDLPVNPNVAQSAFPQTLVEVLTADDDDGNLANGTPNQSAICTAFGDHCIFHASYCPGSCSPRPMSSGCTADCDGDGTLTIFDIECIRGALTTNSARADCNRDGLVTTDDLSCFHNWWARGCP